MFFAFKYYEGKPPVIWNGLEWAQGEVLEFATRAERKQCIATNKYVHMVGRDYAEMLRLANQEGRHIK